MRLSGWSWNKGCMVRVCGSCSFSFICPSKKTANTKTMFCLDLRGNPWGLTHFTTFLKVYAVVRQETLDCFWNKPWYKTGSGKGQMEPISSRQWILGCGPIFQWQTTNILKKMETSSETDAWAGKEIDYGRPRQVGKNHGEEVHCNLFFLGRNLLGQVNLSIGFPSIGAQGTVEETWSTLPKGETNWKQASFRGKSYYFSMDIENIWWNPMSHSWLKTKQNSYKTRNRRKHV